MELQQCNRLRFQGALWHGDLCAFSFVCWTSTTGPLRVWGGQAAKDCWTRTI